MLNKYHHLNFYKLLILVIGYGVLVYLSTLYWLEIFHGGHPFKTGDWLINYQGGLIRRGFIGQLLYYFSGFGINLLWLTYSIQVLIYLLIFHLVFKLFFATERPNTWLLFLFSPAFVFLFPLYDFGASFRKEMLVFLSLIFLACNFLQTKFFHSYLIGSLVLYSIAVLSHELAPLSLIFFLYLLFQLKKQNYKFSPFLNIYLSFYIFLAFFGLLFSYFFHGSSEAATQICHSLELSNLSSRLCFGAIGWLNQSSQDGLNLVSKLIWEKSYLYVYIPLLFISLLPVFISSWCKDNYWLIVCGTLSFFPLFALGIDWGRWIHLYISLLFITIFAISIQRPIYLKKVSIFFIFIYLSSWSIPNTYVKELGLGIFQSAYRFFPAKNSDSPLKNSFWSAASKYYEITVLAAGVKAKNDNANFGFPNIQHSLQSPKPKTLYILDEWKNNPTPVAFNPKTDLLARIDGFNIYAPGWKSCQECPAVPKELELSRLAPLTLIGERIIFSQNASGSRDFLLGGWAPYGEDWGTWSDGNNTHILLPIPQGSPKQLELELRALVNTKHPTQNIEIWINGTFVKKVSLSQFEGNRITLNLPASNSGNEYLNLDFKLLNPVRPKDLGMSLDDRLLGVGIVGVIFLSPQ